MPQKKNIFDQIEAESKGGAIPPPPERKNTPNIFDQIAAEDQQQQKNQSLPVSDDRTASQVALDQALSTGKGLVGAVTGIPSGIAQLGGVTYDALTGNVINTERKLWEMGKSFVQPYAPVAKTAIGIPPPPGSPEWSQAAEGQGTNLGGLLLPEILAKGVPKAIQAIPSKARAVANLDTIMASAKNIPLDLTEANNIIDRSIEISKRGGSPLPKPMSDLRAAQAQGPVTFEAGKDFASSASSQSIEEKAAIKGQMKSQVAQFAKAVRGANRAAAEQVGMGNLYDQFVKEYSRAASLANKATVMKEILVKAAIIATGGAIGYELYRK